MIRKLDKIGIAIEDNCAIVFLDGKFYRVISSKPRAGAYIVSRNADEVVSAEIGQKKQPRPIHELFAPNPRMNLSPQGNRNLG